VVDVPSLSSTVEEEKNNIAVLNFSLRELATHIALLENGLSLFDFCTEQISSLLKSNTSMSKQTMDKLLSFNQWRAIAARDCCMQVFHFAKTMEGIKTLTHATSFVSAAIDREKWKSANALFNQRFRDFEELRNAIAHVGELRKHPENWKENAAVVEQLQRIKKGGLEIGGRIMQKFGLAWVEDYFLDRTFYHTFNGRVVSLEISRATIEKLVAVKDEFYRSFPAAA
jgi:hypothetical protein